MPQLHGRPVCRELDIVQVRCERAAGEMGEEKRENIIHEERKKQKKNS